MSLDDFIAKYNNKGIDFDGAYGFQCMDLAHRYAVDIVGIDIPAVPGAKDEWTKTISGYDKIANTPTGLPKKGDIVIWGTDVGAYGHIAVFVEGNLTTFTSFDQNWPINSLCHKQSHNYKGVLGWFHPKNVLSDSVSVPKKDFENLVRKSGEYDKICSALKFDSGSNNGDKIISAFENLKSDLSKTNKSLAEVEAELTTCLNETSSSNPTDNPEPIPSNGGNGGATDPVEGDHNVPSGDTGDTSNVPNSNSDTIPQNNEAVDRVLQFFKTFFDNLLKWFR